MGELGLLRAPALAPALIHLSAGKRGVLGSSHRAAVAGIMLAMGNHRKRVTTHLREAGRKERTMHKLRRARRQIEQPPFGRQVAFARIATALALTSLGAVAIGVVVIRALRVKRGSIEHLDIEELEVGRLHVRELVVEQEQSPRQGA